MKSLDELLKILDLKKYSDLQYGGDTIDIGSPQVYGGQVLAQGLQAAFHTVSAEKSLHSLHSYFLSPGNKDKEIIYEVSIVKTGRSFDSRRVRARQGDRIIFIMAASYHIAEEGFEHHTPMPNVAQPESLSSIPELFAQVAEEFNIKPKGIYAPDGSILFHPVEHYDPFNPGIKPPTTHVWFKINGEMPDSQTLRKSLIAYASDFNLLMTSLRPHDVSLFTKPMRIASLDHAMWFHRPLVEDDWMLYAIQSPNASGALGYCKGEIFSRKGQLLASVTQEGLIRPL